MRETNDLGRRSFLKGAAIAGGATLSAAEARAQTQAAAVASVPAKVSPPTAAQHAAESDPPPEMDRLTTVKTGSDFMVDVCKTLQIDYMAATPGSTFRALQESFVNYGGNTKPEWLTCLHEEVSVAMCHGYAKVAGKPMAAMMHGTVGLQHGSMAIYNAWCDRVPMLLFTANAGPIEDRRPGVEWTHTVQDNAAMVRDFTKWDDYPWSLQAFAESTVRGYGLTRAEPPGPVLITADGKLQESPLSAAQNAKLHIPKLTMAAETVGHPDALAQAAKMLVAAEHPVIIVDRFASSQAGMDSLAALAEALQAPVIDMQNRMNMATTHHLSQSSRGGALLSQADCILSLEPFDLFGQINRMTDQMERTSRRIIPRKAKVITISTRDLLIHANFQDFQRYDPADLAITGDAQATVPYLTLAVLKEAGPYKSMIDGRGQTMRDAWKSARDQARDAAALTFDANPISGARLYAELWNVVKAEDWAFVGVTTPTGNWPHRLWPMDKHYHYIGYAGGAGVGYDPPAAVGAALAHRDAGGRLPIAVVGDGTFNMAPTSIWTAAHHKIPVLFIIHNNRAYHQEIMHIQRMANRHNRGVENAGIGTVLTDPLIDYASLAKGYGVMGIGPITDPKDLHKALVKGVAAVKAGQPALIDVVMQPRG